MDQTAPPPVRSGLMDFRSWVREMERSGHLVRIADAVDPLTEAGAIMRLANERGSPAQWFTNPTRCMPGATLLGGPFATKERIAMALGLSPDTPYTTVVEAFASALRGPRIKPVVVPEGICHQNVLLGEAVDLALLPVPKLHPQDGGPCIGTLNIGVCKEPDSDWVNWGTYRGMVHDPRSTGLFLTPFSQGGHILRKYHARKQAMEYAMFFGGDPMHNIIASSGVPLGTSEADVVGGIRGEPVRLVRCKTVDLYVPENAEIVLEGAVSPDDEQIEGPFGEVTGYVVTGSVPRPVFRLSAMTWREAPILPATCLGVPVDDGIMWVVEVAGSVKEALQHKGVPIVDVAVPECSGMQGVVVATKTPHAGIPQLIASVVWTDRNGRYFPYVIVVDENVDPWNLGEVFHALCTKCNPVRDIHVYPGHYNSPLSPYMANHPQREVGGGLGGGNVLMDCTWPIDWKPEQRPHRLAFQNTYPEDLRQKVLTHFARWGLAR